VENEKGRTRSPFVENWMGRVCGPVARQTEEYMNEMSEWMDG
jgi:hypothetical protein